ncbi:MAG: M48 family metalloprotease [Armatimonadota bacterium]|nr:M48 family metalloprotease [Armatimonadota bacterium]
MNRPTAGITTAFYRLLAPLIVITVFAGVAAADSPTDEVDLGKDAVKQVEQEVKVLRDPIIQARLDAIGQKLAEIAKTTVVPAAYGTSDLADFKYSFKLIDNKDVNAFALPGGFIYVNKGLIDFVLSDSELAAVISHEIAHVSHHHMVKLIKKQSKMNRYIALLAVFGALSKMDSNDLANVLYGAQMVRISKINGYGETAELDADRTAVTYMVKAGYDPIAMLTFMDRLTREVENKPRLPLGIFRTHPHYRQRADTITAELDAQGIAYDRGLVDSARTARVDTVTVEGKSLSEIRLADKVFFRPADTDTATSAERAAAIVQSLNTALHSSEGRPSVRIASDESRLLVNGSVLFTAEPRDAMMHDTTCEQLVQRAAEVLRFAIWCDHIVRAASSESRQ